MRNGSVFAFNIAQISSKRLLVIGVSPTSQLATSCCGLQELRKASASGRDSPRFLRESSSPLVWEAKEKLVWSVGVVFIWLEIVDLY
jgi:hypothetical protein